MHLLNLTPTVPWLSLIWLSLLLASLIIAFLPTPRPDLIRWIGTGAALLTLILSLLVLFGYDSARGGMQFAEQLDWVPQLGIGYLLGVDGISLPLLVLNGCIIFSGALMSWTIDQHLKEYWILLLLLAMSAYGVLIALDLFLLLFCYQLTLLLLFALAVLSHQEDQVVGAIRLTLYTMAGSAAVIMGLLALYFGSGLRTFNMLELAHTLTLDPHLQVSFFPPLFVGFALLAGLFPFRTWLPIGHLPAPTAVSMLHAAVLLKLGSYGCLRVALWLMPHGAQQWRWLIILLALLFIVYAAAMLIVQRDFSAIIGYVSAIHIGLIIMALSALSPEALSGAVLHMFVHGLMIALLLAVVGHMLTGGVGTPVSAAAGFRGRVPSVPAILVIIGGLAALGLPGLAGFPALWRIFSGVWVRDAWLVVIAAIAVLIGAGALARATYRTFFTRIEPEATQPAVPNLPTETEPEQGPQPQPAPAPRLSWQIYTGGTLLAALLLLIGLYPAMLTGLIESGITPVVQQLDSVRDLAELAGLAGEP